MMSTRATMVLINSIGVIIGYPINGKPLTVCLPHRCASFLCASFEPIDALRSSAHPTNLIDAIRSSAHPSNLIDALRSSALPANLSMRFVPLRFLRIYRCASFLCASCESYRCASFLSASYESACCLSAEPPARWATG